LDKLDLLKAILKTQSIVPNEKTYASMINAYGRLGCLSESKKVFDEMKKNKVKPTANTFSNLLCGCVGERTGGYKEALQVLALILYSQTLKPASQLGFGQ
jgi:pentatricopeptide repeat protein